MRDVNAPDQQDREVAIPLRLLRAALALSRSSGTDKRPRGD